MTTKLSKLAIGEISVVDKGASPGAHIKFFKRDEVAAFKAAYPKLGVFTDEELATRLGGTIAKAEVPTDAEVTASLLRQLADISSDMKDGPAWLESFSAAIHRHAEAAKAKIKQDRATLAGQIGTPPEPSASRNTTKSATASVQAGAKTAALADRMLKAAAPKPAAELLEHRALMLKAELATSGKIITSAQAYTQVLTDPQHAALAKSVRDEERAAARIR